MSRPAQRALLLAAFPAGWLLAWAGEMVWLGASWEYALANLWPFP